MSRRPPRRASRAEPPVVATLARRGRMMVAEPLFERGGRVEVPRGKGVEGDLVLLGSGKRGVRIMRVIGKATVARHVVEALMLERGLRRSFPRRVDAEADQVGGLTPPAPPGGAWPAGEGTGLTPPGPPGDGMGLTPPRPPGDGTALRPPEASGRTDLTHLPTFTVDPDDARDFDDAISAERLEDGAIRLWVHIADVSAYVRPGGAIDTEALRRGTSTYVPGAVEPMLPEQMSNGACSLRPGEDRLAVTVEVEIVGVDVRRVAFHRALIRSDKRLTYGVVDDVFEGRARAEDPWAAPLEAAREVARALRARRDERGALEVSSHEPTFKFDSEGNVVGVSTEAQTEAHTMIEELMILANEQVAGHLADRRLPTIYRVHERPDPPAVEALIEKLAALEVPAPALPKPMSPQQAADLASEASRMVAEYSRTHGRGAAAFGSLVLRSLKRAFYTPRNVGHAGLASPRYCHFTSPIRRYPDLVVHRALLASIGLDSGPPLAHELDEVAQLSSEREREAMQIERRADDVCLAFLLERRLAERKTGDGPVKWKGEVVGLIPAGWFVRFGDERFEGMLPVRRMKGWWQPDEHETRLEESGSGRAIRLGDEVEVEVARIDRVRGRVDLDDAAAVDPAAAAT